MITGLWSDDDILLTLMQLRKQDLRFFKPVKQKGEQN